MLVNTGRKDKKGNSIYVSALNGREEIPNRVSGVTNKTKHTIPSYAFSCMGLGF